VLADGTYGQSSPFTVPSGFSLYAEHVGGAVLTAGVVVGGNFGPGGTVMRGLKFDLADSTRTLGGGVVHVWGAAGAGTQILDCVLRGHATVPVGILVYNAAGLRVQRVEVYDFSDVGVRVSDNVSVGYGSSTPRADEISDVYVDGVSRSVPGSSNGTAESGVWIGHPVVNGVHRLKIRNVAWAGLETVNNAWDTSFTDLDIDMSGPRQAAGVGVYLEHYSRALVFDRFTITGARVGVNAEWADPATGGVAGAHYVTLQNGLIDSAGSTLPGHQAGVYLDEGTEATTVRGVTFRNQNWASIGAYKTVGQNVFEALDTSGLAPGATAVSTAHI
jgi:hypothetical protein